MPVALKRPAQPRPRVQVPLFPCPQHDWPEAPHVEHLSPVAEITHEKPVEHSFPLSQQAWSAAPHAVHIPTAPSTSSVQLKPVWQLPPMQQAAPAPPQGSQVLLFCPGGLLQPSPALQVSPPQQG